MLYNEPFFKKKKMKDRKENCLNVFLLVGRKKKVPSGKPFSGESMLTLLLCFQPVFKIFPEHF